MNAGTTTRGTLVLNTQFESERIVTFCGTACTSGTIVTVDGGPVLV